MGAWTIDDGEPTGPSILELAQRIKALEEHIVQYGPKVKHADYATPGGAHWEAPYKPMPWKDYSKQWPTP